MKHLKPIIFAVVMIAFSVFIFSCKGKDGSASVDTTTVNAAEPVDTSMIEADTAHMTGESDSLTTPKK